MQRRSARRFSMVTSVGSLATIACKPRQVRKEATVASDSGAGVWLAEVATSFGIASWMISTSASMRSRAFHNPERLLRNAFAPLTQGGCKSRSACFWTRSDC